MGPDSRPHLNSSTCRSALPALAAVIAVLLSGWAAAPAQALHPGDLLLVCNAELPVSCELAEYYARVRSVPAAQICRVRLDSRPEEISAASFQLRLRDPIRTFLKERGLADKVRCLVTFYGLPIRVGPIEGTLQDKQLLADLERQAVDALDALEKAIARMDGLGKTQGRRLAARKPTLQDQASIVRDYSRVRRETQERLQPKATSPEGIRDFQTFVQIMREIEGSASIIEQIQVVGGQPGDESRRKLEAARQEVRAADERIIREVARSVTDPGRSELRELARQYRGWLGLLQVLDGDIQRLRTDETGASVDSELSMLWYDDYPRWRWVLSALAWTHRAAQTQRQLSSPVPTTPMLMVSRLDASRPAVVQRMIDDALAAEKQGLVGKVYLDARGIYKQDQTGQYDASLRDLELLLKRSTPLSVTLDNKAEVFERGACRNTMLYCGWYNLRKYVDSFTFVPGAVAVHIASFEAVSLKAPAEQGWCTNLLDAGAAATIGPVAEPYLHAFPLPREFFGLLLTGRFTLAECYAYTNTLNSWMMMLLGDPLYRPFAARPLLAVEQVFPAEQIPPEFRTAAPGSMPTTRPGATGPSGPPGR